jgi:uncharacterized ion transporter superfamily protein YfcC
MTQKKPLDSIVIVSAIIVLMMLLTWIIPSGEYARETVDGKTTLVPNSFQFVENEPVSFWRIFTSPVQGLVDASHVIAFVLLIGGAFGVVAKTKAMDAGLKSVVNITRKHPRSKEWLVAALIFFFSLAGNTFGMAEEVLVFILITIPLARDLGYDTLTGVAIPFVGAAVGFAGAAFNPFTVGIAHGLSDLKPFSGAEFRMVVWLLFTLVAIVFILMYNRRVLRKGSILPPESVPTFVHDNTEEVPFDWRRKVILLLFASVLFFLILGVNRWDWYIDEIAGLFIGFGLLAGAISRLSPSTISKEFVAGAGSMLAAALVIGLARTILVIAQEGMVIDTLLHYMAGAVSGLPAYMAAQFMFVTQGFINFFIPSGSGQAALTMPVMAPLSDLLGISRQTAVLCFQLGDGLYNLIIPTSGITMGILSIAGIPFRTWIQWIWKFMIVVTLLSMLLIAISVQWDVWA